MRHSRPGWFVQNLPAKRGEEWNSFLGSDQADYANDLAVDSSGNVFITGSSASTWGTPLLPYTAEEDAFAAKPEVGRDLSSAAYEQVGDELRPLPVGASFDRAAGIFYWPPGPGFVGEYTIVFLKSGNTGSTKRTVKIVVGAPAAR